MKWYKKLSLVLAGILCFGTVGCSATFTSDMLTDVDTKTDAPGYANATGTTNQTGTVVTPVEQHYVQNTLHKVNVSEPATPIPFVDTENQKTDYTILIGSSCSEGNTTHQSKAALFFKKHLREITGATIGLKYIDSEDPITWTEEDKYIVLDDMTMFTAAGLTMPQEDIGPTGYYIKSKGNSVFVMCNTSLGYSKAILALMREQFGYEQFSADCIVYDRADKQATLLDFDIIERPDFDYNLRSNKNTTEATYGMNFVNDLDIFVVVGAQNSQYDKTYYLDEVPASTATSEYLIETAVAPKTAGNKVVLKVDETKGALPRTDNRTETWHNMHNYNPIVDYGDEHPLWFASYQNDANSFADDRGAEFGKYEQICPTAHGDAEQYEALYTHVANTMIALLEANPTINTISYSEEDNYKYCNCDACTTKMNGTYNGKMSGLFIELLNNIDNIVQAYLENKAVKENKPKRDVTLLTFAYHYSIDPPLNDNGEPLIKCNDNVGPYIAPISAQWDESFYNKVNEETANNIKGWAKCSNRLYMWLYETNYFSYLYPHNTWDTMLETYRFCKNNNAMMMFPEGQFNQGAVTHFSRVKEYFNSKAHFDLNINFEDMLDRFFENYFREAAPYMRAMFDQIQARMRYLERKYTQVFTGSIYIYLDDTRYWPEGMLRGWMDLVNQAYAAIAHYEAEDPTLYKMLYDHINLESIFPRWALIDLYISSFSEDEKYDMKRSFVEDCTNYGISKYKEHDGNLDTIFKDWNVI